MRQTPIYGLGIAVNLQKAALIKTSVTFDTGRQQLVGDVIVHSIRHDLIPPEPDFVAHLQNCPVGELQVPGHEGGPWAISRNVSAIIVVSPASKAKRITAI